MSFMRKRRGQSAGLFYPNSGVFIKLSSIERVSVLSKFREPFIKKFTKFEGSFAKFDVHGLQVDFTKA